MQPSFTKSDFITPTVWHLKSKLFLMLRKQRKGANLCRTQLIWWKPAVARRLWFTTPSSPSGRSSGDETLHIAERWLHSGCALKNSDSAPISHSSSPSPPFLNIVTHPNQSQSTRGKSRRWKNLHLSLQMFPQVYWSICSSSRRLLRALLVAHRRCKKEKRTQKCTRNT